MGSGNWGGRWDAASFSTKIPGRFDLATVEIRRNLVATASSRVPGSMAFNQFQIGVLRSTTDNRQKRAHLIAESGTCSLAPPNHQEPLTGRTAVEGAEAGSGRRRESPRPRAIAPFAGSGSPGQRRSPRCPGP